MADRTNRLAEHQQMVKQMLERQNQQNQLAEEADARRRKALREEETRLFLLTPEGKAWQHKMEQKRIKEEAEAKFHQLVESHVRKREALRLAKFEIGTVVVAYTNINPIPHHFNERLHYKICIAPFDPQDTEDFSEDPHWVLIDDPTLMKSYRGVIAFCDKPMKQGQQAKIIKLSEKSCMIQPIALIPKKAVKNV